jgi:hypothetical protein
MELRELEMVEKKWKMFADKNLLSVHFGPQR